MRVVASEFHLPPELEAKRPPEARGLQRDQVRLLVSGEELEVTTFDRLATYLRPGDLVVYNDSATLPAALLGGKVHLSTRLGRDRWVVEVRDKELETGPIPLPQGGRLELLGPYAGSSRLQEAHLRLPSPWLDYLNRWGRPIRYSYLDREWPLSDYQTIFARRPGSAEMPSAGRAFSSKVLQSLVGRGVGLAPLTLHTGVSSLENPEPPYPEWYEVPLSTLNRVKETRSRGGRVVAVGTTVVRALSSITATGYSGWTDRIISPQQPPELVDGILTGLHEPRASHLELLTSLVGTERLRRDYGTALSEQLLWHEFGDLHLLWKSRARSERALPGLPLFK